MLANLGRMKIPMLDDTVRIERRPARLRHVAIAALAVVAAWT